MAPIKFEENIKDKLENRVLQPSSESWNRLANQLELQDKKKSAKRYLWIGIAASLIGIGLLISQLFKTSELEQSVTEIVNTERELIKDKLDSQEEDLDPNTTQFATANTEETTDDLAIDLDDRVKENLPVKNKIAVNNQSNSVKKYAETRTDKTIEKTKVESAISNELSLEQVNLNEAVAQIKTISKDDNLVTDEDVDALLRLAELEITKRKSNNESTKVVDANTLLQDVEAELDQSFRDKVFKTLKTSYYTVKTAVADRNN